MESPGHYDALTDELHVYPKVGDFIAVRAGINDTQLKTLKWTTVFQSKVSFIHETTWE